MTIVIKRYFISAIVIVFISILLLTLFCFYKLGVIGIGPLKSIGLNRSPIQLTELAYEYESQEFITEVDGQKIVGTLVVPKTDEPFESVMILSHGFSSSAAILTPKAKSFAQAGVPTLVYDFRGGSNSSKSDGSTVDMSITTEKADLNAVINQIKEIKGFENARIYLMGESLGGLISALVGAERDDIDGLLLCYPGFNTVKYAKSSYPTLEDIPDKVDLMGTETGRNLWLDLWSLDLDLYDKIAKYTGNVLIMHGTEDTVVTMDCIQKANSVYQNSSLFVVEGAGHGFYGKDEKSVLKSAYEFIVKDNH